MRSMIFRQVKLFAFILCGYLMQVCVMPYFKIGPITPNMMVATIAIVTVGYGRLRALWTGLIYSLLLITFLSSMPMIDLLLYPISALLFSVFCADKTASRLQYERSIGKAGRNISPLLRTVVCAFLNAVAVEFVNLVYTYLLGATFTATAFSRALTCVLCTTALTALIMLPARRLLGFRKPEPEGTQELRFGKPLKLDD